MCLLASEDSAAELGLEPSLRLVGFAYAGVEPELMAEIEYRARSAEGKVRHPIFKGIREDL